jgi:hypothetical protein
MIRMAVSVMLLVLMVGGCVLDEKENEKEPEFQSTELKASDLNITYRYDNNDKQIRISGSVTNTFSKPVSDVSVVVYVYSKSGSTIGYKTADCNIQYLSSGNSSTFEVVIELSESYYSLFAYSVTPQCSKGEGISSTLHPSPEFQPTDLRASNLDITYLQGNDTKRIKINGTVTNTYTKSVNEVSVVINVYSKNGNTIGSKATDCDVKYLSSGSASTFEVVIELSESYYSLLSCNVRPQCDRGMGYMSNLNPSDAPYTQLTTDNYYPMAVGLTRSYDYVHTDIWQNQDTGTMTESIIETISVNGKNYYVRQRVIRWDSGSTLYNYLHLRLTTNSVYWGADSDYFKKDHNDIWTGEMNYYYDDEVHQVTLNSTIGKTSTYYSTESNGNLTTQNDTHTIEDITVNGIEFPGCVKIIISGETTLPHGTLIETFDSQEWYAKGIGMVRSHRVRIDGNGNVRTWDYYLKQVHIP